MRVMNNDKHTNKEKFYEFREKSKEFGFNDNNIAFFSMTSSHPVQEGRKQLSELNEMMSELNFSYIYSIKWSDRIGGYFLMIVFNLEFEERVRGFGLEIKDMIESKIYSIPSLKFSLESITKEPSRYKINPVKYGFNKAN